ncbi:MAG: EthD domain-containing protein [Alphaproteobacteria bacterium]
MIKVIWFLKRAETLELDEFQHWWAHIHAPQIAAAQGAYLRRYTVNLRRIDDPLVGRPADDFDWDGAAEQWFETEADFNAAQGAPGMADINADTGRHVSRVARMVVSENLIALG